MARPRLPRIDPSHASALVGVAAAMVVALLLNVVVARRFTRWDWTTNKRYSLSAPTVQTLRELPDTVQVWVLLGSADPLEGSVKQLLTAYRAETSKLDVRYVDPDRDPVALDDLRRRFNVETARTDSGHNVADAIVIVARGDKRWFLRASDMVEVASGDETRVKPREEQALTSAIRAVLAGEKARLCFTTGHGEMSPLDPGPLGAGVLKDVLEKDNYEVTVVDPGAPNAAEPFQGCTVAVVAGLRDALKKESAERLRTYLLGGGNLLLAASPITGSTATGLVAPGVERVLGPFGIVLDDALVLERSAELAFPEDMGIRFVATAKAHAVTSGLVKEESSRAVPRVVVGLARSMRKGSEPGSASPVELLSTSADAFGLTSVIGASEWKEPPSKRATDLGGPLVLGMAAERAKLSPSAPHGPRAVVLGTASMLTTETFRMGIGDRGAAVVVGNAISWLAAKPQVLDIPEKAAVPAGIRMTEDSRSELRRYVLLFMPGAFALAGVLVALARRAGEKEKAPREGAGAKGARGAKGGGSAKKKGKGEKT